MGASREESQRKLELLDRYRALRSEELLAELREECERQRAAERFPWKSAFRDRGEILDLYRQRRHWDRRFLIDSLLWLLICLALLYGGGLLVQTLVP